VRGYHALAALGVASILSAAADASAFCRTTTSQVPAGYNPAVYGCWEEGTPVAWTAGRVPYSLSAAASRQISLADATRVAHQAFGAWNEARCGQMAPTGPNVQAYDNGPVSAEAAAADCGLNQCDPTYHDSQHVIVFRDDEWPYNDTANTLALTTVTFGVDSAEIFDADIEINSAQHTLTAEEPPPSGTYDLQAILTHEAGHFFGLAHATNTGSIMYAFYKPGALTLTQDDVNAVCAVYAPLQPVSGCTCAHAEGSSDGAFAAVGMAALALVIACRSRRVSFRWTRRRP
jgi:MYXO-CTERM domain-containing protein